MRSPRAPAGTSSSERLERMRRDRALLAEHFPSLTLEIHEVVATAEVEGALSIEMPDGTIESIKVHIEFGHSYPLRPPQAYDAVGRWKPDPARHIEPDGHFCLFLRGIDEPDMKPEGAILGFIADLEGFLYQQVVLDSQREFNPQARFPGPEWPHGYLAYELFVLRLLQQEPAEVREALWDAARRSLSRTSTCPCGSGTPYGDCHLTASKKLRRSAHEAQLHELTYGRMVQDTQTFI